MQDEDADLLNRADVDFFTRGAPPSVNWLVRGLMPIGTAGLLVAAGDMGKGMLTLDLALKVTRPRANGGLLGGRPRAFGHDVMVEGSVVIFSAQDSRDQIHRRIHGLDPKGERFDREHKLRIVCLPNETRPMILFRQDKGGVNTTPDYDRFVRLLKDRARLPDLKLVVLDPLQSFAPADINTDPPLGTTWPRYYLNSQPSSTVPS